MSNKTCIGCSHFMKGHLRKFTFSGVQRVIYLLRYYFYYSTLFFNIFMNPLTGNRTYIQERTLLRQTISTVQWFGPWTVLMLFTWSRCCDFTFEWILAIASIKSTDFFSCKIQVFCHLWSFKELHWVWFSSTDLQHGSEDECPSKAKQVWMTCNGDWLDGMKQLCESSALWELKLETIW